MCILFCRCHFQYIGLLYSSYQFMDEPPIFQQFTLEVEVHSGIYICNAIVSTVDYGLLLAAKLIGRADNPFTLQIGGIRILLVVWLVKLVILGLLLAEIEYNPANAVRFTRNFSNVYH